MNGKNDRQFPIGTIVYYGPDDKLTTKIVATVFQADNMPTASKTWSGEGVVTNAQVIAEIGQFFKENGVERVVMAGGNAGCPHEAGVDYPVGEACPFCPYWNDK